MNTVPSFGQTWNKYWIYYFPLWLGPVLLWMCPEIVPKSCFLLYVATAMWIAAQPYQKNKVPHAHMSLFGGLVTFLLLIGSIFVAKNLHVHYGLLTNKFVH